MSTGVVSLGRSRRLYRRRALCLVLLGLALTAYALTLMIGQRFYGPVEVLRVLLGDQVPGASFTIAQLRLPRASLAALAGAAFGLGGITFQTMLRNPLAAPDIIGITSGASAAAVVGLIVLHLDQAAVGLVAVNAAMVTALAIYGLSYRSGVVGARLILIGIGVAAMLDSVVAYVIIRAAAWDVQTAMRWLTGSLNAANWTQILPLAVAAAVCGPILFSQSRNLQLLQLGDDAALALGVRGDRTRLLTIVAAVALLAFATAAAGPIAFVAFLSGPIAARIVGPAGSLLLPSALVGALLVLLADLAGQFAFETRYPVGIITGMLGAPYLVYLLIRSHRSGGTL